MNMPCNAIKLLQDAEKYSLHYEVLNDLHKRREGAERTECAETELYYY